MVFQMIPPVPIKTCAWNILLSGEFMILIPSVTVSRFAVTHIFLKVLSHTAKLFGMGPNVTRYFDWSV